ncbi:hypothetical protein BDA99DRAFT_505890 [Phascolomyces articulosus]|uniref:Uncharacterized protein n=1 Tax=Phascolomyces articulosus TaxID=60185 RepID=A0AAD5K2F6_9FUNG|nr:hypothetical protein BDA99DRAFT_505890 [Phascolomyces articulosus]
MLNNSIRFVARLRPTQPIRHFSQSRLVFQEKSSNINDFPWLVNRSPPRIAKYPYIQAPTSFGWMNILPASIQHRLSVWLASRTVHLNTGASYFPEQFLLGATFASRRALNVLSQHLNNPDDNTRNELEGMMSIELLDRFTKAGKECLTGDEEISINLPQIYDANLGDVWVTLGSSIAFTHTRQYEVLEWMTLKLCLKTSGVDVDEESFRDYRARVARGLMEGVHIRVDVEVDADVVYKISRGDDVLLYDEGRRTLLVQFETPYFEPAHTMISGRDPENGEPINDWSWVISDIDQLITKEKLDNDEIMP